MYCYCIYNVLYCIVLYFIVLYRRFVSFHIRNPSHCIVMHCNAIVLKWITLVLVLHCLGIVFILCCFHCIVSYCFVSYRKSYRIKLHPSHCFALLCIEEYNKLVLYLLYNVLRCIGIDIALHRLLRIILCFILLHWHCLLWSILQHLKKLETN
jgi:hypothetical protein